MYPASKRADRNLYPVLKPVLRRVWRNAGVVTASSVEHQRLAYETLDEIDIPIIYNGVDTNIFHPVSRKVSALNILCVGRLIERKGQHHLLRAFARLKQELPEHDICLTLVGTGDAEVALKALAGQLGIQEQVEFKGMVSREDMPEIYRQANIFVLPSQSEGMSVALLEALASGLPVVVSDTGGTHELVSPGENGLVVRWADVEGLAQALERMVKDMPLRENMGRAARQTALRFSWSQVAGHYLQLMEKL